MDLEGKYCMMQIALNIDNLKHIAEYLSNAKILDNNLLEDNRVTNIKRQVSVLSGFGHSLDNRYEIKQRIFSCFKSLLYI